MRSTDAGRRVLRPRHAIRDSLGGLWSSPNQRLADILRTEAREQFSGDYSMRHGFEIGSEKSVLAGALLCVRVIALRVVHMARLVRCRVLASRDYGTFLDVSSGGLHLDSTKECRVSWTERPQVRLNISSSRCGVRIMHARFLTQRHLEPYRRCVYIFSQIHEDGSQRV